MRKIILGFIISISIATMNAQEYGVKFGKVSKEDLSLNVYEADTTAEAVILYEEGMLKYDLLKDGYYHESELRSAPSFDKIIDGISELNQLY